MNYQWLQVSMAEKEVGNHWGQKNKRRKTNSGSDLGEILILYILYSVGAVIQCDHIDLEQKTVPKLEIYIHERHYNET